MAANILPDTINPDLDIRDVIVMHNFRFQVGLFDLTVKHLLNERVRLRTYGQFETHIIGLGVPFR